MEILEMITEWRKGCSVSKKHPIDCPACTEQLIDAIERKEKASVFSGCITPRFDKVIERLKDCVRIDSPKRRGMREEAIVSANDVEAMLHEFYRLDRELRRMHSENAKLRHKLEPIEEEHRVC